jgi:hypothetical protein
MRILFCRLITRTYHYDTHFCYHFFDNKSAYFVLPIAPLFNALFFVKSAYLFCRKIGKTPRFKDELIRFYGAFMTQASIDV